MKRLALALALILGLASGPAPPAQAAFVHIARTTDGVLIYVWQWVSTPGVGVGGFWTLIGVEPV